MKTMEEIAQEEIIVTPVVNEDLDAQYNQIIESLQTAKENKQPIDEGIIGALVGGVAGATLIPKVMNAVCAALGIDPHGQLGSLMTSRLIMSAVGAKVGWKI